MMWGRVLESLQGVPQPDPPKGVKVRRPVKEKEMREASAKAREVERKTAAFKESLILDALQEHGTLNRGQLEKLRLGGFSYDTIYAALRSLRRQGKVRFVEVQPYWEVVD